MKIYKSIVVYAFTFLWIGILFAFGGLKVDSPITGDIIAEDVIAQTGDFSGILTVGDVPFSETIKRQITVTLDSGGSVLTTGSKDIGVRVPCAMTLTGWEIKSYPTSSTATLSVDIWYEDFADFPATAADSIVSSSTPTLTSAIISSGTTSGWGTVDLAEGGSLEFSVLAGVAVSTRAVVALFGTVKAP